MEAGPGRARLRRFRGLYSARDRTGARPRPALEHEVAALKERPDVIESELREKIAQVGHADAAMAAHVYSAEQRDVSC